MSTSEDESSSSEAINSREMLITRHNNNMASNGMPNLRTPTPLNNEGPPAVVLASAGYDHTIRFWDVIQGNCIGTLQHNESQVNCLALSKDKLLLAAGGNPAIRLFDTVSATRMSTASTQTLNSTANIPPIHVFEGHASNVMAVGFEADCRWMWSASEDGTLRIWDIQDDFSCLKEVAVGSLTTAVLHPNQQDFIIASDTGMVKIWRQIDGSFMVIGEAKLETKVAIRDISISPNGSLIAVIDHTGGLSVWSLTTMENNNDNHNENENDNNNNAIATTINGLSKNIYKLLLVTKTFTAHHKYGIKCIFSPDSQMILTCSADSTAKLWHLVIATDLESDGNDKNDEGLLELAQEFIGHTKWLWDCAFSADSAYVITCSSDETVRLWDVNTGESIAIYAGHSKAVTCVALNDLPIVVQ